jgi:hypothetical protein
MKENFNLRELTKAELSHFNGGGFFEQLGSKCKKAYNSFRCHLKDYNEFNARYWHTMQYP